MRTLTDRPLADPAGPRARLPAPRAQPVPPRAMTPGRVLALQGVAGNRAVGTLLQRHASFEHTLLGNTPPDQLAEAAVSRSARSHLLYQLREQTIFFQDDALRDPRSRFPDVRWLKLRESGLWLSYGEMSSIADYLPSNVDDVPRSVVLPVLQRMRRNTAARFFKDAGLYRESDFAGQADAGGYEVLDQVKDEKAVDKATAGLGSQRYFGLVARNACHFAPESWHRWARYHEEASDHALAYHRGRSEQVPVTDRDGVQEERERRAWVANGYGDHFLQDSFAAGHLVNKTLVMQWFVDYVNGLASAWWDLLGRSWWGDDTRPWWGMADDGVMATMGTRSQPNIAGQGLYNRPTNAGTPEMDSMLGDTPTDPQTMWERQTHEGRVAGSGVVAGQGSTREQNYHAYLRFLNSSFLQLAAGQTHDYWNERGMLVVNERGDRMRVGGDATLLTQSGELGARIAGEAAQASQQAISDLMRTGGTDKTVDQIGMLWPTKVWVEESTGRVCRPARAVPLQDWHEDVLHRLCREEIFPDVVDSFNSKVARAASPQLVEGGFQDRAPAGIPLPDNLGDFVTPRGDPMG